VNNRGVRRYSSAVRAEQARRTRARIAVTAADLIVAEGYAAVSVADIARAAEVSPQTVYNTFGTKPRLLKAAYDVVLAGDDQPVPLRERPEVRALYEVHDPGELLHGYARLGRTVLERVGPLMLQIVAGAAAGDPDLTEHRRVTDEERLLGTGMVATRVQELGGLSPRLTWQGARDRIWTLNSVEVWHLLTGTLGWSGSAYEQWIGEAMCAAVLG
jgi:AcrR family transcriptional regulator